MDQIAAAQQQQLLQALLLQQMMQNPALLKQAQDMAIAQAAGGQAASGSEGAIVPYGGGNAGKDGSPVFIAPPNWVAQPGPEMQKNLKKYPCKFFAEGKCAKGENCTFSHEGSGGTVQEACRDFAHWGSCPRGDACLFSHNPAAIGDLANFSQTKERATCSIHGQLRTLDNLVDDGEGGMKCVEGQECRSTKKPKVYENPDWNCPECGDLQFGRKTECNWCGVPNPAKESVICVIHGCTRSSEMLYPVEGGGWTCENTVKCKPKRWVTGELDWTCPKCGDYVYCRRAECRRCGTINPAKETAVCSKHDCVRALSCLMGDGSGAYQCSKDDCVSKKANEDWHCPQCNELQYARNDKCRWCKVPNPNKPVAPPKLVLPPSGGKKRDWETSQSTDTQNWGMPVPVPPPAAVVPPPAAAAVLVPPPGAAVLVPPPSHLASGGSSDDQGFWGV